MINLQDLFDVIRERKDNSDLADTELLDGYVYGNYYFEFAVYRHRYDGVEE